MRVLLQTDNSRHRTVAREGDRRIAVTACGVRVATTGGPCPDRPGHLIALPDCPMHTTPTTCRECYP